MSYKTKKYFIIYDFFNDTPEELWPLLSQKEILEYLGISLKTFKKFEPIVKADIKNGK